MTVIYMWISIDQSWYEVEGNIICERVCFVTREKTRKISTQSRVTGFGF